jgi:DNA adenine methylase
LNFLNGYGIIFTINEAVAKPFIKWAGGKGQLLSQLDAFLPNGLKDGETDVYIEPFVGGGAMLFHILNNYDVKRAVIADINKELINVYRCVKSDLAGVINELKIIAEGYAEATDRQAYFYRAREYYNSTEINGTLDSLKAAGFIFLNKACFNGLYRVNKNGEFNVPFGGYKNPNILGEDNLRAVSALLKKVEIVHGEYKEVQKYAGEKTFVYFDPPYRPLNVSSFTKYTEFDFGDEDQRRLADFFKELDKQKILLLLSNSDLKNANPKDDFFENLYNGFEISRAYANRIINCQAEKRGRITEIVIRNYKETKL